MADTNLPAWLQPNGRQNTSTAGSPQMPNPAATKGAYQVVYEKLSAMDPQARKALAATLKAAGYKVPANGAVGPKMIEAVGQAQFDAETFRTRSGNTNMTDQQYWSMRISEGSGGSGGSGNSVSYKISSDTDAKKTIQAVYSDLTGRIPTEEEVTKYTNMLRSAQKKNPTRTVRSGDSYTTTGGLDEEQFLFDKLVGSDAAKENRAMEAYAFLNQYVLGGGA